MTLAVCGHANPDGQAPCESGDTSRSATERSVKSLVLRAWLEPGTPPQLRVRVVDIAVGRGERPALVTTSVDEACRAVRIWLEALQGPDASANGDGTVTRGG